MNPLSVPKTSKNSPILKIFSAKQVRIQPGVQISPFVVKLNHLKAKNGRFITPSTQNLKHLRHIKTVHEKKKIASVHLQYDNRF